MLLFCMLVMCLVFFIRVIRLIWSGGSAEESNPDPARCEQGCRADDRYVSAPLNRATCLQVGADQSDLAGWI